jgi:hypothetical protein
MSMVFVELQLILAFFSREDDGLSHCKDCCFLSGLYPQTQDSSSVMILDVKDGLSAAHSRRSWHTFNTMFLLLGCQQSVDKLGRDMPHV